MVDVRGHVFGERDFPNLDANLRDRVTAVLLLDVIEHVERPVEYCFGFCGATGCSFRSSLRFQRGRSYGRITTSGFVIFCATIFDGFVSLRGLLIFR
jgi:hypothetical protein